MAGEMFMTVNDVAEEMGISVSYAYRIIRRLNKELNPELIQFSSGFFLYLEHPKFD